MAEGQRVRKLGSNMKPRGKKGVKPKMETNQAIEMPTVVGQEEEAMEVVLGGRTPADNSASFQAENSEKTDDSESENPLMVAHDPDLAAALSESAEAEKEAEPEWPTHCAHGKSINEVCKKCEAADMGNAAVRRMHGDLGPQPDGSLAFRGMIPEEYVEAVTQWAEENDVPIAQWCNDRLYEYISTYGSPAKGR